MAKKKVETIDVTPTWHAALNIYLMCLESGTAEGRREAREGLRQMADVAQQHADLMRGIKDREAGLKSKAFDSNNHPNLLEQISNWLCDGEDVKVNKLVSVEIEKGDNGYKFKAIVKYK